MNPGVTIVIPTIPPRVDMVQRAVASVLAQTCPVANILVVPDTERAGAWATRWRGALQVTTEWTGFLDDDDVLLPHHVEHLLAVAAREQADMVWGWFQIEGPNPDPFPHYRGKQYDPASPHIVPITYLARTAMLQRTPGFQPDTGGVWDVQDQPVLDGMCAQGARLFADPETTWLWYHHYRNTSGLPDRW